jgi:D-inositol-3-phosphate glycosyltransferase
MSVYVREVAKWLGQFGHRVDIFTCVASTRRTLDLYPNVRLIRLNPGLAKAISKEALFDHLPAVVGSLVQYAQSSDVEYDLVHSHYWLSGLVGAVVQRRWNCPHITMFHTLGMIKNRTTAGESEPNRRIDAEREIVDAVNAIVAPVDAERQNLLDHYGALPEKIRVIPCGVNMDRFKPMDREHARTALNIEPASRVILFVGRFAPVKGLDHLLEAVAELVPRCPRVKLLVVGGDGAGADATVALKRRAQGLGIASNLWLAGRVEHNDAPLYYNAADLLALPSTYESFGLVTLESLACGTPVAATSTGGAVSIIREGINGVLIGQPHSRSVRQGIEKILNQLTQQLFSKEQIRASVSGFSWQCIAAMNLKSYEALLYREKPLML